MRLVASPACPAPTTTVVNRSMVGPAEGRSELVDLDGHVRRVRDDVVYRGALLRLSNQCLDLFLRRVGVDVERDLDVLVAVAHVAIDAEDALDVHLALEPHLDAAELDAAVLRDRRNAGREAAREPEDRKSTRLNSSHV